MVFGAHCIIGAVGVDVEGRKHAEWLERECRAAAASLLEGLEECFTINRLEIPTSLHRCLATTNVIESPHAGVRMRTNRVSRWKDGKMLQRWVSPTPPNRL